MQKSTLSGRQLICITAIYIIGSSSVIGNSGLAKKDSWFAMLLAVIAVIPLILLYARLLKLYPGQNLFEMFYTAFGQKIGWIVTLLMTIYCFQLGTMVLRDFPEFVQTTALRKTPVLVFTLLLALVCAYFAKLGIDSFGKASVLFSWVVGIVVIFTFLFLIPRMDLNRLRPVLATPPDKIAWNAGKLLSAPFGETVLLLCVFCNIKPEQSGKKSFLAGLFFGGAYLFISVLRNILVLGAENFASLYFPSYSAVSAINVGDFFQRIEVVVAGYLLICDILKISIAIYAACLGVAKLLKLEDYGSVVFPVTFLMVPLSVLEMKSIMQFYRWNPWYLMILAPFQLILPLFLWLLGEGRNRRKT